MQSIPASSVLLDIYRRMTSIKTNDTRIIAAMKAGRLTMPYYSPRGQECIPAAVSVLLTNDDYIVTIYRGIHDMIAKGVPVKLIWAEFAGRSTGTCKGKGGPMHITHPATGCMVTTGVVGSGMPIALRSCAGRAGSRRKARDRHELRRRRQQHRRISRVAEPGIGMEAARDLPVSEQPLRRTHGLREGNLDRVDRRARQELQHSRRPRRRQRSGGDLQRRHDGNRTRARGPGTDAARGDDLPFQWSPDRRHGRLHPETRIPGRRRCGSIPQISAVAGGPEAFHQRGARCH